MPRPLPPGTGRVLRSIPTDTPLVALTLDDAIDHDALDVLAERGVKATLFLTGAWIQARPDTAIRAVQEGHELGNHTWGHPHLPLSGYGGTLAQIDRANQVMVQTVGAPSAPFFRPPYGEWNASVLQAAAAEGDDLAMWEVDSQGYIAGARPEAVAGRVLARAHAGSIILMHPLAYGDRYALAAVIDGLRAEGLEPGRLSDLLLNARQ
jgi:peptidoglycan/xylan/chitin deacetylase (PgdA/CDA1 family)